ncbi:protein CYCLOPS [Sesamum alatum]|uniref:Protein CYCLOPS n=1 Tax=Sesamum alatum TaxID=300844 RepID=A0AAE2CHL5_9LAMI|nr:protein CYCLOPS [Sesamum alatum]
MDGRSFSELYRNTSEELFIKTMMESSVGMSAPTMEMLGFKNLTQNFRTDSEELFKSWLTSGENNGCLSTGTGTRPRQASRRISTELASLTNQNTAATQKKPNDNIPFPQSTSVAADSSNDLDSTRMLQASNLFLAKAWFHSPQPMTRSRSSELRRRYVAMQNSQTPNNYKQEPANGFSDISTYENPDRFNPFVSPSNSASSTFDNPQVGNVDKISSVVSMLKGTLERKKLVHQVEKEVIDDDSSLDYYSPGEVVVLANTSLNQGEQVHAYENQGTFQDLSTLGVTETRVLQTIEESLMEGIMGPQNPTQMSTISREPSQSESSAGPPLVSNGFDMSDDPYISAQAPTVCESSRNQMGSGRSPEDCLRTKGLRERIHDNSREDQKQKGGLIRYGSATSAGSADRGDPTKKRRVERSRKMAEAKERSSTPAVASDMQAILKRCENLEKEVRSLKLNLAFMNRKDSEQTKQIEELQKQNQELADEKERLLEEIERILAETGKM